LAHLTGVQRRFGTLVLGGLMPFQLGLPEVILVLVIALVFLGPKRLPEAGQALGKGMREFRQGIAARAQVSLRSTMVTIGGSGFDWVLLDIEHSPVQRDALFFSLRQRLSELQRDVARRSVKQSYGKNERRHLMA